MASTVQFNDARAQEFSFKPPTMKYIFDNISYKHLYKLYQCCKLFPNMFPLTAIHRFENDYKFYTPIAILGFKTKRVSEYFKYNGYIYSPKCFSRIWLSDEIRLRKIQPNLSEWISKIWICTIKKIVICNQDLSLNEFEILAQNESVKSLEIRKILDENGTSLAVEKIISYLPNASKIQLPNAVVTSETFIKLAAMERKSKLRLFYLQGVNVIIDYEEMLNFIEATASNEITEYIIYFAPPVYQEYVKNFHVTMKTELYFQERFRKFKNKPSFNATT